MKSSIKPSESLQQAFRVIGLWATVLVVLIHYRTATVAAGGLSGTAQEFLANGIARVAVPIFAFAAGYFYFVSATGSWDDYCRKLSQRSRTVLLPYLLVSLIAFSCWGIMQCLTHQPIEQSLGQIASRMLLHPLAEQLWFLRDLFLLVLIAPLIRWTVRRAPRSTLVVLSCLWAGELQPMPIVAQWYLLNIETWLFFTLGCLAVDRTELLERVIRIPLSWGCGLLGIWLLLVVWRVSIDPTFDLWYVRNFTWTSLVLQKGSIILGGIALFGLSRWLTFPGCNALAASSFFVYLTHEFPLREVMLRIARQIVPPQHAFWLAAPVAIVFCFAAAMLVARHLPLLSSVLTGGRSQRPLPRSLPNFQFHAKSIRR